MSNKEVPLNSHQDSLSKQVASGLGLRTFASLPLSKIERDLTNEPLGKLLVLLDTQV